MSRPFAPARYSRSVIALHWLTVLLLVAVFALIEFKGIYPKGSPERDAMKAWHFTLGMTVFVLTWLRLIFRAVTRTPPITPAIPAWQRMLSQATHGLLYAMMVLLPFSGWIMVSAAGGTVWFWATDLPALIAQNKETAHNIKEVHEAIGNIGLALIGLHAVAAIYHHHFMKDDTLTRMLPGR